MPLASPRKLFYRNLGALREFDSVVDLIDGSHIRTIDDCLYSRRQIKLEAVMKQILIIDDDEKLGQLLTQYLGRYDMQAHVAVTPSKGFELLKKIKPDLLILDVMLPEKDGFEICREIRAKSSIFGQLPILMLTAHAGVTDRIVGLELGADDYLPKPFNPRELLARINAILRRQNTPKTESKNKLIKFGVYEFNTGTRSLSKDGKNISITAGEFDLLKVFTDHSKQPLSRDQLMQLAKGKELDVFDRSIDVQISRLRRLIEDNPNRPRFIQTKWGYGYIFNPDGEIS